MNIGRSSGVLQIQGNNSRRIPQGDRRYRPIMHLLYSGQYATQEYERADREIKRVREGAQIGENEALEVL